MPNNYLLGGNKISPAVVEQIKKRFKCVKDLDLEEQKKFTFYRTMHE